MELREWLIILGLVLVTIIVVDGVRRLQRQRKVPRLDQAGGDDGSAVTDPEEAAKQAEINWELPNGGARVVRPATHATVEPKPKLQRQEHPGPSKVFSRMGQTSAATRDEGLAARDARQGVKPEGAEPQRFASTSETSHPQMTTDEAIRAERKSPAGGPSSDPVAAPAGASHVTMPSADAPSPLHADADDEWHHHDAGHESLKRRFTRGGMAALRSGSQRVSQSMQRMSTAFQRHDDAPEHTHREPSLGGAPDLSSAGGDERQARSERPQETRVTFEPPFEPVGEPAYAAQDDAPVDDQPAPAAHDDVVTPHPVVEKARRHHVSAQRARETLAHAEEVIVISVMARNEEGFAGPDLLNLMLACGLRYSEMGIFLRYETEDVDSDLQFAMVDVVKPGTFDLEAMDDFATPGVTFLMPLPGAQDSAAAFEAMVETAMVLVRNLGGELKDENRSVMTAQTVGFARQRVQEFERRHRLHRYQAN